MVNRHIFLRIYSVLWRNKQYEMPFWYSVFGLSIGYSVFGLANWWLVFWCCYCIWYWCYSVFALGLLLWYLVLVFLLVFGIDFWYLVWVLVLERHRCLYGYGYLVLALVFGIDLVFSIGIWIWYSVWIWPFSVDIDDQYLVFILVFGFGFLTGYKFGYFTLAVGFGMNLGI